MNYHPQTVREIVWRYNEHGPDSMADQRLEARGGHEPLLDQQQCQQLEKALQGPAPDGGLWNSPKVARWMSQLLGRNVDASTGWRWLKRLGWTTQTPRPRSNKANDDDQESF